MTKRTIIGWTVSLAFLTLAVWNIEWTQVVGYFGEISAVDILVLVAIYLAGFAVRGLRCYTLLPALGYERSLKAVIIGYAANNLLPARLGELVRAQIAGSAANIRRSVTLSSIVVERILDGFAIVILLIIGSGEIALPDWAEAARMTGLILFGALLAGVLFVGHFGERLMEKLPEGRFTGVASGIVEGVSIATRDFRTVVSILLYSFLVWFVEGMMFWYGLHVFGISATMLGALFVLGIVNLGVLIPSSPGNVGVFQYFAIRSLAVLGVAPAPATAYAFTIHICQYLPVTLLGLLMLPQFGTRSFAEVKESSGADDT